MNSSKLTSSSRRVALAAWLFCASSLAQASKLSSTFQLPVLLYNTSLIQSTKARIASGDPALQPAYYAVLRQADGLISSGAGPWSVVDCPHTPPSGDRHDYMSVSKYFWPCNANPCNATAPNCDAATGLPWLDCDGRTNYAAVNEYDLPRISNFTAAATLLAQAYLWSGNVSYANTAAGFIRHWFLDPASAMNPNGNFMQAVPGVNNGSVWGLIEITVALSELLDSIAFIQPSGAWSDADTAGMTQWLREWAKWVRTDPLPRGEAVASNNHQTYFDQMAVSTAVWIGNVTWASEVLRGTLEPPPIGNDNAPIGVQIWGDGELPQEEARTNSVGYVQMDLLGLMRLGLMSRYLPIAALGTPDLFGYVSKTNGSSIQGAMDFMVPYALSQKPWPHQNIGNESWSAYYEVYRRAAHVGWSASFGPGGPGHDDAFYATVASGLPGDHSADATQLFWPWP